MSLNPKKRNQTAVKGKSSALLITIIIHAALFVAAGYFVAMEVIDQKEAKFTAKQIVRPKMKMQKLKMPVKLEQKIKRAPPKLSQRVTAKARLNTKSVDFKMPEITGIGGAIGGVGGAKLGAGSLGFSNIQINVFGAKSKGEKFLFILSTDKTMLEDQMGGIPAYRIIKNELMNLTDSLPPTALFNLVLIDDWNAESLFENLSPANTENRQKLRDWLNPLNEDDDTYGFKSLASRGTRVEFEPCIPISSNGAGILRSIGYAIEQGADSVFALTSREVMGKTTRENYDLYRRGKELVSTEKIAWFEKNYDIDGYGRQKWNKLVDDAKAKLAEENAARLADGQPIRVIAGGDSEIVISYFGEGSLPSKKAVDSEEYEYTSDDLLDYMENLTEKVNESNNSPTRMRFNVIQFTPQTLDDDKKEVELDKLRDAAGKYKGAFREIQGLEAIRSASSTL